VETRGGDRRPILSDLRESGAIEQDADIVSFIYRPEYYGIDEDADGNATAGTGELIVAKHRNGALGTVRMKFVGRLAKFANLDSFEDNSYGNAMKPNTDFGEPPTITVSSKMNEEGGALPEDPPF
jgi:replicative DNA helicase